MPVFDFFQRNFLQWLICVSMPMFPLFVQLMFSQKHFILNAKIHKERKKKPDEKFL